MIEKPPSAELRPDQRDDQSLPPYDVLDAILAGYVEDDLTAKELIERGHDAAIVNRITRLVDIAEYKRRQSPRGSGSHRRRSAVIGGCRSRIATGGSESASRLRE
ncbi:MAG: hypothetical protein R2710_21290 [Acidimicrobiales bacterium]